MRTSIHTVKHGNHVLAIRVAPGQKPQVHTVLYNMTLAEAHTHLSRRRDLIVH